MKQTVQTVQDMKTEIGEMKKAQTRVILEMENLGKWMIATDAKITKRIQDMEERISGVEDTIEEIDASDKELTNS